MPNGDNEIRTRDPLLARQVLSQLSYTPGYILMGLSGLEPPTSRLSGVRSNRLSYKPLFILFLFSKSFICFASLFFKEVRFRSAQSNDTKQVSNFAFLPFT